MFSRKALVTFLLIVGALFAYNVELISDSRIATSFEVEFNQPQMRYISDNYWLIKMADFGLSGEDYGPQLFARNFQIAIPRGSDVEVLVESIEWGEWLDISPAPKCPKTNVQAAMGEIDPVLYAYPSGGRIEYNGRKIIRGVEITDVLVEPVEFDPARGVRFMHSATIEIRHTGGGMTDCGERLYHPDFEKLYRGILVNPDAAMPRNRPMDVAEWDPADGAELLVIVRPDFTDEIESWIDWKLLQGLPTHVVTTDSTGTASSTIQAYIQNAYDTWAMPPVYLLLVADADYIPSISGSGMEGDNNYATVDGTDIFPDIYPSRISVDYSNQIELQIEKHHNFETHPDTTDDWWARAVGIVNEDDPTWVPLGPQDSSYLAAVTYGMGQCTAAGFSSAPMFRRADGDDYYDVRPYVQAGLTFVQYRGQAWPDYYYGFSGGLDTLENGGKCPINISITCGTGAFMSGDTRMCERSTRAGSVGSPKGAVCFMGQSLVSSNSEERSSLSKHVFEGFFEAKLNELAAAHTYGKIEMYSEFGSSYDARYEYLSAIVLGSPEMLAWTAPIDLTPEFTYPSAVDSGFGYIDVHVEREGADLEDARVALHQGTEFSYALTDAFGDVSIGVDVDATYPLIIVITGPNIYPYIDTIEVVVSGVAVYSDNVIFDDYIGDSDGLLNPGETVRFYPKIYNLGSETAAGLSALLSCDADVEWIDSLSDFPIVAPGDTVLGDVVEFHIPQDEPAESNIRFSMNITGHPAGPWDRIVVPEPAVVRFAPVFETMLIDDAAPYGNGDSEPDAGEVLDICLRFSNNTFADAFNVHCFLQGTPEVAVINDYALVESWPRSTTMSIYPCFTLSISPDVLPGTEVILGLAMEGRCSVYTYIDTLPVPLTLGGELFNLPSGPDTYGYYIYEDVDSDYPMAPTYEWMDISSIGSELTPISDTDDGIFTMGIPFTMSFYGEDYDTISISSNGFIAPGRCTWSGAGSGTPQQMPYVGGPDGIITPAWADLAPHRVDGGEIYGYHNTTTNQLIVQWDDCEFYYGGGNISCQLRICDPATWTTPTGDSEFFMYYESMTGIGAMGIGIESEDESDGLQYYLNGAYDEHAVELAAGRALRITTLEPPALTDPWLYYISDLWFDDSLDDNDGTIEPCDRVGIRMRIINDGGSSATSVQGQIVGTSLLTPYGSSAPFGTIAVSANSYNSSLAMHCDVSGSCSTDTVIQVPIYLTETGGYSTTFYVPMHVGGTVSVTDNETKLPRGVTLGVAYPNPFNGTTSIDVLVGLDAGGPVEIEIFDITGRRVDVMHSGQLATGIHTFRFDSDGHASGVYFARLRWNNETKTRKMVLIE